VTAVVLPDTSPTLFTARLEPDGPAFAADASQPLLQALERAGIAWPSSCRNGTCRTCIGRLEQGAVRYEIPWPGLSPDEKAEGCVLPCVAFPVSGVVLRFTGL
jgi:ferredoxin